MAIYRAGVLAMVLAAIASVSVADVYMHNPRGSNDRNCERNVNRNNGNRMFDSQNNAKGGYACPRAVGGPETVTGKMYYYAGSKLPIEWTAQHGCGTNPKEHCELVLQFACEDTLDAEGKYRFQDFPGSPRDGTPRGADDAATDTIPVTEDAARATTIENRRFGMHENYDYYMKCQTRSRNRGLFTADQNVRRRDARGTRQNPNGNRNGLECPEERDYYPYWHPTPWRDVAVLTSDPNRCDFYETNYAMNPPGECERPAEGADAAADQLQDQGRWYNRPDTCEEAGFKWVSYPYGDAKLAGTAMDVPACKQGSFGRINHLGNTEESIYDTAADAAHIPHNNNAARYVWTIPDHVNENCVLRMRYNISTADYNTWEVDGTPGLNSTFNGRDNSPIKQDPYIPIGTEEDEFVSLAMNTNQYSRTFQDRSYVFEIKADPRPVGSTKGIYNLNVRGKRGNIVQTYPAVEYDFVPNDLNIDAGDMIHFQWTGSDYNPRRGCNNGEGGPPDPNTPSAANQNSRADRSNIVEMTGMDMNMPRDITTREAIMGGTMFTDTAGNPDMAQIKKLAFLGQKETLAAIGRKCLTEEELDAINNKNERENHPQNCAKLNAAFTPYFDAGLVTMNKPGAFAYFSSRNNNFSNRDQTGRVCVNDPAAGGQMCGALDSSTKRGIDNVNFIVSGDKLVAAPDVGGDNLLTDETFADQEKDNDSKGDGEAEDCELMKFNDPSISAGAAVVLAFAMLGVGVATTLGVQYGLNQYRRKHGLKPGQPLGLFSRSDTGKRPLRSNSGGAVPPPPARGAKPTAAAAGAPPPPPPRR